ncbi:MAG TPA: hypothetical protein ENN84_01855 [Candidatus Marinimicrobia bacterium]|nr:hypothetical protein [Candidatus Neomarinimicrobiota bacterium]
MKTTSVKENIPLKYFLEYSFLRFFERFFSLFPDKTVAWLGRRLGDLLWLFFPYRLKVMVINLGIVFPQWSRRQILKKAHKIYRFFGEVSATYFILHRKSMITKILNTEDDSPELFSHLLSQGKGILYATLHCGHWEALVAYWQLTKLPFSGIYKVQKNPLSHKFFDQRRLKFGDTLELLESKRGISAFVENIQSNRVVVNAIDQSARSRGIEMSFFGEIIEAPRGNAKMKILSGAPLVFGYHRYVNGHYYLHKKEIPLKAMTEINDENIRYINEILLREAEEVIRNHPEQWMWFHKLWKGKYKVAFRRKWYEFFL